MSFPSVFCPAVKISDESAMECASHEMVQVRGQDYFVGHTALMHGRDEMISGLSDSWINQSQHVALLLSGINRVRNALGKSTDDAIIVIGLPARQ